MRDRCVDLRGRASPTPTSRRDEARRGLEGEGSSRPAGLHAGLRILARRSRPWLRSDSTHCSPRHPRSFRFSTWRDVHEDWTSAHSQQQGPARILVILMRVSRVRVQVEHLCTWACTC